MYYKHITVAVLLISGSILLSTSQPAPAVEAKAPRAKEQRQPQKAVAAKKVKGGAVIAIKNEAQYNEIISGGGLVVVDIYASWCGPCKQFAPIYEQVAASLSNVTFVKIEGDAAGFENLVEKLNVRGYPTVLVFKNGKQIGQYRGDRTVAAFSEYIQKLNA